MLIGIDTGGTYTDAVLFDEATLDGPSRPGSGVVAWSKTRTRPDLTIGIRQALEQLDPDPANVSLVSLSTTLATNALVEGVGGRVALVLIGFDDEAVERGGLAAALGSDPLVKVSGGHNSYGVEATPVDLEALAAAVDGLEVDAFAVAAHFSVRNPEHELAARDLLAARGLPVACSHELSAKLNGPKRALTCLLNARLLPMIDNLCQAAATIMDEFSITAPLMLVRGDGSLVSAEFALSRPIETILSGPAASVVGAGYLLDDGRNRTGPVVMVSDIGGTTTDIGLIRDGRPTVSPDGAVVGGHHTMVEAVDMFTIGLGGDSEIHIDRGMPPSLRLGPRRLTPLSLAATDDPDVVHRTLDRRRAPFREDHVLFARPTGRRGVVGSRDERLLAKMVEGGTGWRPIDQLVASSMETAALRSLVGRGLAQMAGFTPSDACHVLGLQDSWDTEAAANAAAILAGINDNRWEPLAIDGAAFSRWVIDQLVHQSAEAVLAVAFRADGMDPQAVSHELVQRALTAPPSVARIHVGAAVDLVGLGASAATYYPAVAKVVGANPIVPPHAHVANAVGAVVGQVRIAAECTISQPSKGQYRIHWPGLEDRGDQQPAIDDALVALRLHVRDEAERAGAGELTLSESVDLKTATIEGREVFVEATITVVGVGRPRFADG
ncbi:MAG: hydantoinase/oxoprolinase family protein [Acidimicrobiia bacterium]|nr:hydantoinase/oxoprolinase family protein [Acidimicrobiia bacterium]